MLITPGLWQNTLRKRAFGVFWWFCFLAVAMVVAYFGGQFMWQRFFRHAGNAGAEDDGHGKDNPAPPSMASLFHHRIPPSYAAISTDKRNDYLNQIRPKRDICAFVPSGVHDTERRKYVQGCFADKGPSRLCNVGR